MAVSAAGAETTEASGEAPPATEPEAAEELDSVPEAVPSFSPGWEKRPCSTE